MVVFIGWSGQTSKEVAKALHSFLGQVIQAVKPWMSEEDLEAGVRWSPTIADQLEMARVGITCLTPDNLAKPWVLFEAGALSKAVGDARLCPYLYKVRPVDLEGPLAQFQYVTADEEGTRKLLKTINGALEKEQRSEKQLDEGFKKWWPDLKRELDDIPPVTGEHTPPRSPQQIAEETLALVRELARYQTAHNIELREMLGKRLEAIESRQFIFPYALEGDEHTMGTPYTFVPSVSRIPGLLPQSHPSPTIVVNPPAPLPESEDESSRKEKATK
jgi:hypothetical protein